MANDVEVKIGANTTSLEDALQNSGKAVRKALDKISEGFAKIQHDFAQGFTLDTRATEEALKRSKQVFNDTRTDLEKYHSKLNELNALHKIGAIDATTHARALKQLEKPPSGLLAKLKEGVDGVKASFDKLNPVVEIFNAGMKIGEKLKQAADGVKDMDTEARKMGNALGIGADEAHVLNTALGSVFQDKATYISAASTLSQNIHKNGAAFERLGISTKDAQGKLLPMSTLLGNTTSKLLEYKEGADRNIMSNQLLGKSWDEVENIAKLTPQVMADAAKEVRDYHKELDPEAVKRYSEAMSSASGAFEGIQTAIGKAAMPALSTLGEWLGSIGPGLTEVMIETINVLNAAFESIAVVAQVLWDAISTIFSGIADDIAASLGGESITTMQFFVNCIKVIEAAFIGLRIGVEISIETIKAILATVVTGCIQVGTAVSRALALDFEGAKEAWRQGGRDMAAIIDESGKRMVEIATKGNEDLQKALLPPDATAAPKHVTKGHLSANSLEAGNGKSSGTRTTKSAPKAKTATEPPPAQPAPTPDGEIAQLKAQLDNFKLSQNERLRIATDIADKIQQKQNSDPAEYEAAQQKIIEIDRQKEQELLRLAEETTSKRQEQRLAAIDVAEMLAKQEVENGTKTQEQLLEAQREFEKQRYEISKEGLQRRQTLLDMQGNDKDMVAQLKLLQEKEKLDKDYASKQKVEMSKLQDLMGKLKLSGIEIWKEMQNTISTSATDNFQKVLKKTLSFRDAMKNIWNDIGKSFKDMAMKKASDLAVEQAKELAGTAATKAKGLAISAATAAKDLAIQVANSAQKVAVWIFGEEAKTTATVAGNATRTASDWLAAAESVAASAWSAITKVMNYAWEAMAGAYNAMVGIPIVGPALAVGAGALAFGAVAGLVGNIASASGGYDIPAGINPMTQLHEEEMVLPKPYANVIRDMASSGAAPGAANAGGNAAGMSEGGGSAINLHVHALDAKSVRDYFKSNSHTLAPGLRQLARNFTPVK